MSVGAERQNLQFLAIPYVTMYNIGIDLNTVQGKDLLKNYWKFFSLTACTIYLECGLLNFAAHSLSDLAVATGTLSVLNQGCLILVKMATFVYYGDKFMKLIWEMNRLAENATQIEYQKWLTENRRSRLIAKMYFYICWIAVGCSGVMPIVFMAYDYQQTKEFNKKLPYGGRFPFDNGGLMTFFLNYIFSLVHIYTLLNMTVSMDSLYGWFIFNISAHFRILRCKVTNAALKLDKEELNYKDFVREIGSIVCYHNLTLKFVEQLNCVFGVILWAEVMLSCLQMCFVIFNLNNDTDFSNMPFNFMTLVVVSMQLMIYCFGGEKIKNESLMLSLDIYLQFPWHKMSPQQKKLLLLPLIRSQRLSVLRGLFFEVDRNLLVYIMKTAFSFNALLSAMKE